MDSLLNEITKLIAMPAGDHTSNPEIVSIWVMGIIAHTIAVIVTGKSVQSSMAYSIPKALIISLLNIAALLLALACSNLYIMPQLGKASLRGLAPAAMLIVAITALAALSSKLIHRTKYTKALVTLVVSFACAVGAGYIAKSAFNGGRSAKASAEDMKNRTERAGDDMK